MPRSRTCGWSQISGREYHGRGHCDSRRAPCPHSCPLLGCDQQPEGSSLEVLGLVEIDADEPIAAVIVLDPEDFDAAIAELDARYLAGEAAAHSHTWSVDQRGLRRAQPTRTSPDDARLGQHRPPARDIFCARSTCPHTRAAWNLASDLSISIEAVHRLNNLGAVDHLTWRMGPRKRASTPSGGVISL